MPPPILRLATPADDAALRKLLRDNPMPGNISLSYEREPDYFIAAGVDGTLSQTILSQDAETGQLRGMGTRAIRPMYLNGQVQDVGYMSHLRADLGRPWGLSLARQLARSFAKFRELHADGCTPFYLMSVIADNLPARRLLTSGLPGMPQAREYTRMVTYAVSPRRARREVALPRGFTFQYGTPEYIPEILACLQRNGARHQFAPFWSAESLFTPTQTPNLRPEDFFLAVRGSRVCGCLGVWDQTPFKQTVVRGYRGSLARWRAPINLLARFVDIPRLPPVNSPLRYAYASHIAIDADSPQLFTALLCATCNETLLHGFGYFVLGLSEAHPLRPVFAKSYRHVAYISQIYLMAWEDGLDAVRRVDGRVPGLEVAVL
ncbi:MAG: hypothetical protein ACOYYS_12690 [Chloroflexota bacterium]